MAFMKKIIREPTPEELVQIAGDVDIVIHEGFKLSAKNRIEIFRHGISGNRPLSLDDPSFLALVSDQPVETTVTRFDWNDAAGVADFIVNMPDS
jgi:molybdopterin-guanine dinucleotide biosynthesis protein